MKHRLLALALVALPGLAFAQQPNPPVFLQGAPLTSAQLNRAFNSVVHLNGITIVGACSGNSSPNGNGLTTITVTCPGAGAPGGTNGQIQLNNGGLFQGVSMSGAATMDANGVVTLNTVPITSGGTGATTATNARVSLGISTVGSTGAYGDLTGLPTLGSVASQALPAGPLVGSSGTALTSIPAISGDATLNTTTGILTLTTPIGVAKGGTGGTVYGAHQVLLGNGTLPLNATTGGTTGQVLTSTGTTTDPTWQTIASGSGLTSIANNTLLGNTSGFAAIPVQTTQTAMLDTIGAARGSILERGASGWVPVLPGTAGNCYTSNGATADPTWQSCSSGTPFSGTGGIVGVDSSGTPFIANLVNLTFAGGTGSGTLSAAGGGGGTGGGTELVNAQTGTTYTVAAGDATELTTLNNASTVAVTLPAAGGLFPAGWFADYSNLGVGPVTITPNTGTIDGLASYTLYQGMGVRLVSDGSNYFTQKGGLGPAYLGPLINALPAASAAADADTLPVVQSGTVGSKQTMGAVWTWVSGHLTGFEPPQVLASTNFNLDINTHNAKIVTVTSPITISLPSTLANVGVGFKTAIFNQSGGSITLSNAGAAWGAWATSTGSLSIPNGQMALVTVLQPVSAGVVYASISTPAGGSAIPGERPRVSGRYYAPAVGAVIVSSPTANRITALPIRLVAGTYRGLAMYVNTAPTTTPTTCRMALYSDVSGSPGAVLAENVNTIGVGISGTIYNDFTGGDYTAVNDTNAWVAFICGAINAMQIYMSNPAVANPTIYQTQQMGMTAPIGGSNDTGVISSSITTYPGTTLAATNSGNFGSLTYPTSTVIPLPNIRAR